MNTDNGEVIRCSSIVVATGTFLGGETHIGLETTRFGRINEPGAYSLSRSLNDAGFKLARLKTGTPPRLLKSTIDFRGLAEQVGDKPASPFSFLTDRVTNEVSLGLCFLRAFADFGAQDNQISCFQTETNARTHDIVNANLHRSVHIKETVKGDCGRI